MKKPSPARERLLETASKLFYRNGLTATGIDLIIAESNVAKSTFYRYFPSKVDLIAAYLEHRHAYWMDMFQNGLDEKEGIPSIASALGNWFLDPDFQGCAYINALAEGGAELDGKILEIVRFHKEALRDLIASKFERCDENKLNMIMIVIEGMIVRYQMGGNPGVITDGRRLLQML